MLTVFSKKSSLSGFENQAPIVVKDTFKQNDYRHSSSTVDVRIEIKTLKNLDVVSAYCF